MQYTNTENTRTLQHTMDVLTTTKALKPFTHCYQCRHSHYKDTMVDGQMQRNLVCEKKSSRAVVVKASDKVAGCAFARRYDLYAPLSKEALGELALFTKK